MKLPSYIDPHQRHSIDTRPMSRLAVGPNGRRCCRWCDQEVPKGRQTYCSDACVTEYQIRSSAQIARQEVWRRDQGQCALCPAVAGWLCSDWEMDHIVPVCEGGGSCGLDNLRTLCRPCHKRVTAELAARRARERRIAEARMQPLNLFEESA